jgi:hypothetical protein
VPARSCASHGRAVASRLAANRAARQANHAATPRPTVRRPILVELDLKHGGFNQAHGEPFYLSAAGRRPYDRLMSVPSDLPSGTSPGAASPSGSQGGSPPRGLEEGEKERINRELIELLNELRVALPGAQVLFAFLLAVPFQQRFHLATSFQHTAYFATLSLSLVATALLIAPSALHRLNFRIGDKRTVVMISNKLVVAGIGTLALAMVGVMLLIGDVLYGTTAGIVAAVASAAIFGFLWMGLPLRERRVARAARRKGD